MGFWREQVVPRVANRTLATAEVREMRQRICAGLQGEVVEVGFGSGLNIAHYPSEVTRVYAVEPSGVAGRLVTEPLPPAAAVVSDWPPPGWRRAPFPWNTWDSTGSDWTSPRRSSTAR